MKCQQARFIECHKAIASQIANLAILFGEED
jgi:hypothetical protein